jgi:hypothetical protein
MQMEGYAMIYKSCLAAVALFVLTGAEPAPPSASPPAMSSADAAKAKRAVLRQCKRECERLYPVQVRTVGEGSNMQRTEIVGNVAGHDQCTRACDQGLPAQ